MASKFDWMRYIAETMFEMPDVPEPDKKIKPAHPYVKLLGDDWRVSAAKVPWEGYTDFPEKIVHVPIDPSVMSERTRFHELAHVKWTPPIHLEQEAEKHNVPAAFINAFEDARVNSHLANADESFAALMQDGRAGVNVEGTISLARQVMDQGKMSKQDVDGMLATMYAAATCYGEQRDLDQIGRELDVPLDEVNEILDGVTRPGASWNDTITAARKLKELLERGTPQEPQDGQGEGEGEGDGEQGEQPGQPGQPDGQPGQPSDQPFDGQTLDQALEQAARSKGQPNPMNPKPVKYEMLPDQGQQGQQGKQGEKKPSDMGGTGDLPANIQKMMEKDNWGVTENFIGALADRHPYYETGEAKWGVMRLLRPRLTERITHRIQRPRVKRNDLSGGEIRHVHRLITDEKVLRRKAPMRSRKKVGTMVVDCSGSMDMQVSYIDQILAIAPAATIAVYSSNALDKQWNRAHGGLYTGHLAIVAHKGKRIATEEIEQYLHGGNVVDGEALRWLARQPGPRVWISDGYVSGAGESFRGNLVAEVYTICKRAKIKRFHSVPIFLGKKSIHNNDPFYEQYKNDTE